MENEQSKTHKFWESVLNYDKKIVSVFAKKEHNIVIEELKSIPAKEKKVVLDLGCGVGNSFDYLKDFKEIDAIDFSENMLSQAKKKAQKLKLEVNFFNQNIISFSTKKKYDVILASMSVFPQNYGEFTQIIESIKSHLKKNGTFYLIVQSIESATLYFQIKSQRLFNQGKKPQEVIAQITAETKQRNYHPFGYFKTTDNIIQKHWLREELEMRIKAEHNLSIDFIKKLELDWTTQFKYTKDQSEQKLWYWFLKISP